jgi:hypothetical protein
LRDLRHHLQAQGFEVEENILVHGSCAVDSFEEKMGKDVGRVDFHEAEVSLKSQ